MPWAYETYKLSEAMHWSPDEVPLSEDVRDWKEKLNDEERNLLTQLFRFFTQADVDVAAGYHIKFIPYFKGIPELQMMMGSFANREATHINAYSLLLETIGMPEATYQQFQEYKEMKAKHDYLEKFSTANPVSVLKSLAVYSAFTEGMQLFGSFVVLLAFARQNKMKNMGNIIAWSIRDENLHVEGMARLFREFSKDHYQTDAYHGLETDLHKIAMKMVDLEFAFIDLMFNGNKLTDLNADQVKGYIKHLTNQRWKQLGFKEDLYSNTSNPLPWVDYMVYGVEHANFFEQKSTTYAKSMTTGTMEDIEW